MTHCLFQDSYTVFVGMFYFLVTIVNNTLHFYYEHDLCAYNDIVLTITKCIIIDFK